MCLEILREEWQQEKRAVCITWVHRSQTNNRAHFPPSVPEDGPPGSEGRVVVVKPQQKEACWAITCMMIQPCLFPKQLNPSTFLHLCVLHFSVFSWLCLNFYILYINVKHIQFTCNEMWCINQTAIAEIDRRTTLIKAVYSYNARCSGGDTWTEHVTDISSSPCMSCLHVTH